MAEMNDQKKNSPEIEVPKARNANVFVTGDLIIDRNAVRLPKTQSGYRKPCPATLETQEFGGAWYVAELLSRLLPETNIQNPDRKKLEIASTALTLWELLPIRAGEKKNKCWRVSEFIGCQTPCIQEDKSLFEPGLEDGGTLVLDDVGLCFSSENGPWTTEAAKTSLNQAKNIIGKTGSLAAPLWQWFLESELSDKLTLVTTAPALREMGAHISRALSWDAAVEDLQREMAEGMIGSILAPCKRVVVLFGSEGVATFSREPRNPDEEPSTNRLRFEQFIYDPASLEGSCSIGIPGKMFGSLSLFAATVAATVIAPDKFPRFIWLCRALDASQKMLLSGAGSDAEALASLQVVIENLIETMNKPKGEIPPEKHFGVAFPRELLDAEENDGHHQDSLITDLTGTHPLLIQAKAEEIVLRGEGKAMRRAPCAKYGKYTTYDREEIERINSLRNLISNYMAGNHPRPLSVAVFGQPGSGKSFAIKQLARTLFSGSNNEATFNLSQFESLQDLHNAFHQVRDMVLSGGTPLIFWDEFDSDGLKWLKDFLAPMQDGEFSEHGRNHPIGRAIFVFAGGTAHTYAEFYAKADEEKEKKAPDFISRLRGYVDIKGPNKISGNDQQYVIRRALLLRNFLKMYTGDRIIGKDDVAAISPGVLKGLLFVDKYSHGARSMESVVSQSELLSTASFGPSELPPRELLDLHLSPDFMGRVDSGQKWSAPHGSFVDELSRRLHEAWRTAKESDGWTYGETRDDDKKNNPFLLPYEELTEEGRELNLNPARIALPRLEAIGLNAIPRAESDPDKHTVVEELTEADILGLARIEHQRWMRERLRVGYVYGDPSNDEMLRHCDIKKFDNLSDQVAQLDTNQITETLQMLKERGMVLIRMKQS